MRRLNDGLVDIAEAVRTDVPASEIWGDCDPNDVYGIAVVGTGLAFFAAVWVGVGWYIREAHRFHVRFYREHRAR